MLLVAVGSAQAQTLPPSPPASPSAEDSLRVELQRRVDRFTAIRDSLRQEAARRAPAARLRDDAQRRRSAADVDELGRALDQAGEALHGALADSGVRLEFRGLGEAISNIGRELGELQLELDDNSIQLTGPDGDFTIDIPEDLGARISEGLSAITQEILDDLPDSLDFHEKLREIKKLEKNWDDVYDADFDDWEEPDRRLVGTEIYSFGRDVDVDGGEYVSGDVVVIFGNATIKGEVLDNVIAVGGDVDLEAGAEVHGSVISVFGLVDRDVDAEVSGSVVSLDLDRLTRGRGVDALLAGRSGLLSQISFFLVFVLLMLMVFVLLPTARLAGVAAELRDHPSRCLGLGILWTFIGHLVLVLLVAVLVLTVIGIPVALLLLLGYLLLGFISVGTVADRIGEMLAARSGAGRPAAWLRILLGLVVIFLPGALSLLLGQIDGVVGGSLAALFRGISLLLHLAVYAYGTGALLGSRFGAEAARARRRATVA